MIEYLKSLKKKGGQMPPKFTPRQAGYASGFNDALNLVIKKLEDKTEGDTP